MNVLLVYPEYTTTFWSFKHVLKFVSKKAAFPPLGLLTVGSMLPKEWNVRLVDLNIESLKENALKWADMVMVSAMLIQKKSADEVIEQCRKLKKKIVAGGPLFTSIPQVYEDKVDHLVLNEAELTLPPFIDDLEWGTPQKIYRAESFPDLRVTPAPRLDLIDIKKYATMMIQCSRGCPFNCDFCDITNLFGRKPRVKCADQIINELENIYRKGWRDAVFVVDDNFIGNKGKIKVILREMIRWMKQRDYPFSFLTEASVNLAEDDELIELMAEAGFDTVFIGLETPDEKSLQECQKNQNLKLDLVVAIEKLQRAGIQVLGGYIVGFDSDDESIFSRQIKFIQESGVVTAMVGLLNAIPNTGLWKRLNAENRLLKSATGDNTDGTINFIPKMDRTALIEGYRNIVRTIYHPRQFYYRTCRFLDRYRPRRRRKLNFRDIKAFVRSVIYLGILGNGISQWYFWKMLIKSSIFYRKAFAEAMTLMVYGHHFRKISKKI